MAVRSRQTFAEAWLYALAVIMLFNSLALAFRRYCHLHLGIKLALIVLIAFKGKEVFTDRVNVSKRSGNCA